ncbi:hypothetical protein M0804_013594 [Polistes exclamans]|nr:hypothetical protein M0804_013594 [Polistes exclamans]
MEQNLNVKLNLIRYGKNYAINNQLKVRRLKTTSGYIDTDDFNRRDDATKKCKFNPSNSYLSLYDLGRTIEEMAKQNTSEQQI